MQETPDPLGQLLGQLTDLGATAIMQGQQQRATAHGQSRHHAPAFSLSLVIALTLPAASTAHPVAAPCPANDNAEG